MWENAVWNLVIFLECIRKQLARVEFLKFCHFLTFSENGWLAAATCIPILPHQIQSPPILLPRPRGRIGGEVIGHSPRNTDEGQLHLYWKRTGWFVVFLVLETLWLECWFLHMLGKILKWSEWVGVPLYTTVLENSWQAQKPHFLITGGLL